MQPRGIFHDDLYDFFTGAYLLSNSASSTAQAHEARLGGGMMATRAQVGDLELGLLRMFLVVAENGSIGKAAAAVEMTQGMPLVSPAVMRS